jgi:hypothetical protein
VSHDATSAHCMSSRTMTSGRSPAAMRMYSAISSRSMYLLAACASFGASAASAGTRCGSSRQARCGAMSSRRMAPIASAQGAYGGCTSAS